MKKIILFFGMAWAGPLAAQLVITPGAQWYTSGNAQLTLQDMDFINNGIFSAGTGTASFTGNAGSAVAGSQALQFFIVEIKKTNTNSLALQKDISVVQRINFTSGNIDLNGYTVDLGATAMLNGEQENSHIIGASGGTVRTSAVLNAPVAANPGGLGAIITSSQDLGNVVIARGQQSQVNGSGTGNSILRYYDITPANNINLDATLRLQYLDAELNGLPESTLTLWYSTDNTQWVNLGLSTSSTSTNYVEQIGLPSLAKFTLSATSSALPVRFIALNTSCNGSSVKVTWKTTAEQNVHYYTLEQSTDAVQWTVLGDIPAAGNTAAENEYAYTDHTAVTGSYYRIAEYDRDGKSQFSKTIRSNCVNAQTFNLFPNPVIDLVHISMTASSNSDITIKVYDSMGALVKQQEEKLVSGNNLFTIGMKGLEAGLYYTIISNNSGLLKTQKLFKQ